MEFISESKLSSHSAGYLHCAREASGKVRGANTTQQARNNMRLMKSRKSFVLIFGWRARSTRPDKFPAVSLPLAYEGESSLSSAEKL